jgi:hypothetical protein
MANIVIRMDDDEFEEIVHDGDEFLIIEEARRARAMEKQLLDERELHRVAEFHKVSPVKKEQDDKL